MDIDIEKILRRSGAFIQGDHFVYKAGTHGSVYIDKEAFSFIGARDLASLIEEMASRAIAKGLNVGKFKKVGIIGPAMGAISFSLTLAAALEKAIPGVTFFPARTELEEDSTGKKIHVIPDKLKTRYKDAGFIICEDITNNGTTIREVKALFEKELGAEIIAAMCFVDRGGQTADTLGIRQYFPLLEVQMDQHNPREGCPLCKAAQPINTVLGKGERWVGMFGQPIYKKGKDFSAFFK